MSQANITVASDVPEPIVAKLRGLIARSRLVIALRGACATVAVAIGSVLTVMAIDAGVTIFQDWPRWALSAGALVATLLTACIFLVRPLVRSFTMTGIARMIESRHPEMHERLSSALELLTSKDRPEFRGSVALIAALASEATLHADALQVRREVTMRSARPFVFALAAGVVAMLILFLAWPGPTGQLLARALAPGANLPNIHARDLQVTPGDATIAQGQRLEVSVGVKDARVQSAQLLISQAQGGPTEIAMTPAGAENGCPRWSFTCPPAESDFRYRIHAGDALSSYFSVRVVPPPALLQISVRYEYPEYTHLSGHTDVTATDIKAVAGTKVLLTLKGNKPLASAQAIVRSQVEQVIEAKLSPDQTEASLTLDLAPGLAGRWSLRLSDTMGFQALLPSAAIVALRDEPPSAKILSPQESSLHLGREDRLPLVYTVSDDYGLSACQLLLKTENGPLEPIDLPAPNKNARRAWEGKFLLDLSRLRLADAKTLSVQVRAVDNLPAGMKGPQQGLSDLLTIGLDAAAPSYVMQVEMAHELRIRAVLEEVLKHLNDAKLESSPLQKVMKNLEDLNEPALGRIDRMRKCLADAETPLRDLIQQISGGNFAPLAVKLTELADDHIAKAASLAGQLKLADSKKEREDGADEADFQVDRAIAVVSDMLKNLSVMTELAKRSQALADLAQKEQELAAQKAAMDLAQKMAAATQPTSMPTSALAGSTPPPGSLAAASSQANKDWQEKQAKLAAAMNDLVKQTRGALGMRATEENKTTRNLAADARELALHQAALSQETTQAIGRDQIQAALKDLARRQGELAKETAKDALLAEVAKAMTDLSADLAGAAEQTPPKLAAVDSQFQTKAVLNQQQKTAVAILGQAQQALARQQAISQEIAAAAKIAQEQQAAAELNRKQVADLKTQQTAAREAIKASLADLAKLQRDLAGRMSQAENKLPGNPATASINVRPSGAMNSASQNLSQGNLLPSKAAAQQATVAAQGLSQNLANAVAAAQKAATDNSAIDGAAKDLAAAQRALQAAQDAAAAAAAKATAAAGTASGSDQTAQKSQAAQAAAEGAVGPIQKSFDQKVAQLLGVDKVALKSEADAKAARAAANAAKDSNAPDADQKETAAKAAEAKAKQDRAAANDLKTQTANALAAANSAKAAAQTAAAQTAKDRATANAAKQDSLAAAGASTQAQAKIKPAQDALTASTHKQQEGLTKKDLAQKQAVQADASAKETAAMAQEQAALSQKVDQLATGSGKQLADLEVAETKAKQEQTSHEQALAGAAARIAAQGQPQQELSNQAGAMKQGLAQATPEARQAVGNLHPGPALHESAQLAGQGGKHLQATQAAQTALQQTQDFAQALAKGVGPTPLTGAQSDQIAGRINSLSQQQSQIHQQANSLLAQNTQVRNSQRQGVIARLRTEQHELSKHVQEITDQVKELAPQADRLDTAVARQAMQTAGQIESSKLAEAAAAADQTAKDLTQLATRLGASADELAEPLPATRPASGPGTEDKSSQVVVKGSSQQEPEQVRATHAIAKTRKKELLASRTAQLARRQLQVAREMQALTQDQVGAIISSRQKSIAARTEDLANDVELLQSHSAELIPTPQIRATAEQAVQEMARAQTQQQNAQKSLEAQALPGSLPPQQESAAALNRAASALEQLGQQLAQAAAKDAPPADKQEQEESGYLARAAEEADIASRTEDAKDALRAAKLLMELAGLASNRAQAAGVMPLDLSQLMDSRGQVGGFFGKGSRGVMAVELTPEQLESLGISVSDWAKLPGQLRDEVLQAASDSAPPEYRTLIKQYFQEISRRGQKEKK
jgi:hypothetical protein